MMVEAIGGFTSVPLLIEPAAAPKLESNSLLKVAKFAGSLVPGDFSGFWGGKAAFESVVHEDGNVDAREAGKLEGMGIYHVLSLFSQICAAKAAGKAEAGSDAVLVFLSDALLNTGFHPGKKRGFELVHFAPAGGFEGTEAYEGTLSRRIAEFEKEIAALERDGPKKIEFLKRDIVTLEANIAKGWGELLPLKSREELEQAKKRAKWLRDGVEEMQGRKAVLESRILKLRLQLSDRSLREPQTCDGILQTDGWLSRELRTHAVAALGFVEGPAASKAGEIAVERIMHDKQVRGAAASSVRRLGIYALEPACRMLEYCEQVKAHSTADFLAGLIEGTCNQMLMRNGHIGAVQKARNAMGLVSGYVIRRGREAKKAGERQKIEERTAAVKAERMAATSGFWGWRNAFMYRIERMKLEHWKRADAKKGKIACRN